MNWLAHIFLSEYSVEFQIGNFLADPMKGKAWQGASQDIIQGMKIHTLIDTFTDNHDIVSQSKLRLRKKGLLKSIVIDLTYDYFLTKHWYKYSIMSKHNFLLKFGKNAKKYLINYPNHPKNLVNELIESNLFDKYNNLTQLKKAFKRIDDRLSSKLLKRETTISYFDKVCEIELELESDFLNFFPELCNHVKSNVNSDKLTHWRQL